ncbi:CynX/NimT family MFS transporter [Amycolatopsis lurida]
MRSTSTTTIWVLTGLVLLTLNLRAAITGVPPVLSEVQAGAGLTGFEASVLTTLPMLCLGVFSALAPVLARRAGTGTAIAGALVVIVLGALLRVVPLPMALFAGTVLAGAGIATGNVLVPAVIKRAFPGRVGPLTGLAMMLMSVSGAAAAGLAVPLEHLGGWRLALVVWTVPALIAAVVWGPLRLPAAPAENTTDRGSLLRSPLAWAVTIFMGMASLMFYTLTSWLPGLMRDNGFSPATAGMMNALIVIVGIPLGFAVPVLAARLRDQRPLVVAVVAAMALGLGGLLLAPKVGWIWVAIFGLATGSAFPLAYTLLNLRSPTAAVTARLSGMAQSGGYLIAGLGPLTFGVLHTVTGGWGLSIGLLFVLLVPELVCGLLAARPGYVRLSGNEGGERENAAAAHARGDRGAAGGGVRPGGFGAGDQADR